MTTNKSQYTLTTQWIVPEEKKSEFESFFSEHEAWMRETHNLSGDSEPRIVDYSVSKAPQVYSGTFLSILFLVFSCVLLMQL